MKRYNEQRDEQRDDLAQTIGGAVVVIILALAAFLLAIEPDPDTYQQWINDCTGRECR